MSHDPMKCCGHCVEPIPSVDDAVWVWEHDYRPAFMIDTWKEVGPYHRSCAEQMIDDDPDRFRADEPGQEPSARQLERMVEGSDIDTEARANREAGR